MEERLDRQSVGLVFLPSLNDDFVPREWQFGGEHSLCHQTLVKGFGALALAGVTDIECALASVVPGAAELVDPGLRGHDALLVAQAFVEGSFAVVATPLLFTGPGIAIGWPGAQHLIADRPCRALHARVQGKAAAGVGSQTRDWQIGAQIGERDAAFFLVVRAMMPGVVFGEGLVARISTPEQPWAGMAEPRSQSVRHHSFPASVQRFAAPGTPGPNVRSAAQLRPGAAGKILSTW